MKIKLLVIILLITGVVACKRKTPQEIQIDKINELVKKAYPDSLKGINKKEVFHLMKAYAEYSEKFRTDTLAPQYLFKAGETAMNIQMGGQAITYFNDVITSFPDYPKVPEALFLTAFVLETQMNNKNKAKEVYQQFIDKYPNHNLARDAKVSIENMDIPLDELIKKFEGKNRQQGQADIPIIQQKEKK
jgi:TolA-binding protein